MAREAGRGRCPCSWARRSGGWLLPLPLLLLLLRPGLATAAPNAVAGAGAGANKIDIPKIIWVYWNTGEDSMVKRVENRACLHSWRAMNPGWTLNVVDSASLHEYIGDMARPISKVLPMAAQSDLVRLNLLARHGGVYVDADVFCVLPLESWLPSYTGAGMFAFRLKARDRSLASWFLASTKGNALIETWGSNLLEHARGNHNRFKKYFQVHYEFDALTSAGSARPELAAAWRAVPHVNATISRADQCCTPALPPQRSMPRYSVRHAKNGMCEPLNKVAKAMIDSHQLPVLKGIAKRNTCRGYQNDVTPPEGSVLAYLVDTIPSRQPPAS